MHFVERMLRDAVERGELDAGEMAGADLDLDTHRPDGWWAQQFVERERVRVRDEPDAARSMVAEWRRAQRRSAERHGH